MPSSRSISSSSSSGSRTSRPRNSDSGDSPTPTLLSLGATDDPIKFLLAVMNEAGADVGLRVDAAKALLRLMHARPDGKKVLARAAATVASGGRFGPRAAPPHLAVVRKRPE